LIRPISIYLRRTARLEGFATFLEKRVRRVCISSILALLLIARGSAWANDAAGTRSGEPFRTSWRKPTAHPDSRFGQALLLPRDDGVFSMPQHPGWRRRAHLRMGRDGIDGQGCVTR